MADASFDLSELDDFSKKLLKQIEKEMPKETKKFLGKEASKLKTQTSKNAKKSIKNPSSGDKSYLKSIKKGKPYDYKGDEKAVRVYSKAPHAHLIEYGHVMVRGGKRGKGGKEVGFIKGKKVFENARKSFEGTFYKDAETFIDDMLKKGL